jgi:hypothetical protein
MRLYTFGGHGAVKRGHYLEYAFQLK